MRSAQGGRFSVFREDSLGVNPKGDQVIAAALVTDADDDNGGKDEAGASEETEATSTTSSSENRKRKPKAKIPEDAVEDAEEDSGWEPHQKQGAAAVPAAARMPSQNSNLPAMNAARIAPAAVPMGWLHHPPPRAAAAFAPGFANVPSTPRPHTLLYTVGFGIDPRQSSADSWDATEAAVRALRDAMERSTVRLPEIGNVCPFQLHVKLGVPPRKDMSPHVQPMAVDRVRIASVLPRSIPVLPIDVVIGGLSVAGHDDPDVCICAAVACVTVQTNTTQTAWGRANAVAQQQQLQPHVPPQPMEAVAVRETLERQLQENRKKLARLDSMDMLARISAQIREQRGMITDHVRPPEVASVSPTNGRRVGFDIEANQPGRDQVEEEESDSPSSQEAFKKLPPGITAKKNRRHFVQHNYTDHSLERPDPSELVPRTKGGVSTAFPVKLHELLSEIEADGFGFILSWMPHGRAFKIHKQQEFLDIILPNYFVMTKKSSFLRQLNLYGFNRFSAGPDKGAYYHELFLRGKPFLSRRMIRMKVNGKGIRSAGNPETEPDFYSMPSVPREQSQQGQEEEQQEEEEQREATAAYPPAVQAVYEEVRLAVQQESETKGIDDTNTKIAAKNALIGSSQISFPLKLQRMLDKLEAEGDVDVVSWLSHGRAFLVHRPDLFVEDLMPVYFRQTKYSSFQRQLHMYSFQRITAGRDKGAYFHENFLRGKPLLCQNMVRTRVNGKGCRRPGNPGSEPDFYKMSPMPPIAEGTVVEIPVELTLGTDSYDGTDSQDGDSA